MRKSTKQRRTSLLVKVFLFVAIPLATLFFL